MGWESELIGARAGRRMGNWTDDKAVGEVNGSNAVYRCFKSKRQRRKPDASFISAEKLKDGYPVGECEIPPDLIVEVVSPREAYEDTLAKVQDFFSAGTRLAWIVLPSRRVGFAMRPDGTTTQVNESDAFDGEDVMPGFTMPLADLLRGVPVRESVGDDVEGDED